jgi:hypothetical protein
LSQSWRLQRKAGDLASLDQELNNIPGIEKFKDKNLLIFKHNKSLDESKSKSDNGKNDANLKTLVNDLSNQTKDKSINQK